MYCESNYDLNGNGRFVDDIRNYMDEATFYEELGYGYPKFDVIFDVIMPFLQTLTVEGHTDLMYMYMDSTPVYIPIIWFVSLTIFGNFFVLNLLLAVISTNFQSASV